MKAESRWRSGPAIEKPELQRELEQMKPAGDGALEIATLYPQALNDPSTGFQQFSHFRLRIHKAF